MDIKHLIIDRIDRIKFNSNNINEIRQLNNILQLPKYKIIFETNSIINYGYIIDNLTMDNLCELFINGYLNFIINNNNIQLYNNDITILYLLNIKNHNYTYFSLILLD